MRNSFFISLTSLALFACSEPVDAKDTGGITPTDDTDIETDATDIETDGDTDIIPPDTGDEPAPRPPYDGNYRIGLTYAVSRAGAPPKRSLRATFVENQIEMPFAGACLNLRDMCFANVPDVGTYFEGDDIVVERPPYFTINLDADVLVNDALAEKVSRFSGERSYYTRKFNQRPEEGITFTVGDPATDGYETELPFQLPSPFNAQMPGGTTIGENLTVTWPQRDDYAVFLEVESRAGFHRLYAIDPAESSFSLPSSELNEEPGARRVDLTLYRVQQTTLTADGHDISMDSVRIDKFTKLDACGFDFVINTGTFPTELGGEVTNSSGQVIFTVGPYSAGNTNFTTNLILEPGSYTANLTDSWGDGWNGGSFTVFYENGGVAAPAMSPGGNGQVFNFDLSCP